MENKQKIPVGSYIGNNSVNESMGFLRPAADLLRNVNNENCSIEAVKFSACNIMPTYRIFGMAEGMFVRLEEIFGNTLEYQQHTVDTLQVAKLNRNVSKEVNIQDDTIYYPVGSYVHLGFNLSLPNDEVLYVKEMIITHIGVSYTLIDSLGNEMKDIPSGLIKLKQNELNGSELIIWERASTEVYRVDNEVLAGEMPMSNIEQGGCDMMPPEVAEMIKNLEGKTPDEAMALMGEMNNGLQPIAEGQTVEAVAIENGVVANEVSATLVDDVPTELMPADGEKEEERYATGA